MTGCMSLLSVGSWCWWSSNPGLLSRRIRSSSETHRGHDHQALISGSSFIILCLETSAGVLTYRRSCRSVGVCFPPRAPWLSVRRAVINRAVSCVAPSVSAYHSEPPDLFQMSGSNRSSWTVTNCVSLGTPARAKELVNGSELWHRGSVAV